MVKFITTLEILLEKENMNEFTKFCEQNGFELDAYELRERYIAEIKQHTGLKNPAQCYITCNYRDSFIIKLLEGLDFVVIVKYDL